MRSLESWELGEDCGRALGSASPGHLTCVKPQLSGHLGLKPLQLFGICVDATAGGEETIRNVRQFFTEDKHGQGPFNWGLNDRIKFCLKQIGRSSNATSALRVGASTHVLGSTSAPHQTAAPRKKSRLLNCLIGVLTPKPLRPFPLRGSELKNPPTANRRLSKTATIATTSPHTAWTGRGGRGDGCSSRPSLPVASS